EQLVPRSSRRRDRARLSSRRAGDDFRRARAGLQLPGRRDRPGDSVLLRFNPDAVGRAGARSRRHPGRGYVAAEDVVPWRLGRSAAALHGHPLPTPCGMTFRLTMHPGMDGDCLVLAWGTTGTLHHIVVDLGRAGSYKAVRPELASLENIELFVMS